MAAWSVIEAEHVTGENVVVSRCEIYVGATPSRRGHWCYAGRQATRDGLRVYAVGRGRRAQGLSDESGEKPIRADAFETADVARIEVFPTDQATGGGSMVKFPEQ
ncbi:hypothetical protein [Rhizobium ruizarguesonis]|uniref:hypothetical protein n=1 Tax=Rhizobium ruizarguesonis TaxID=2081791 RepID=UPI001FE144C5|nr:hypothetical protein [Rhizobium ruizarguesonis]